MEEGVAKFNLTADYTSAEIGVGEAYGLVKAELIIIATYDLIYRFPGKRRLFVVYNHFQPNFQMQFIDWLKIIVYNQYTALSCRKTLMANRFRYFIKLWVYI